MTRAIVYLIENERGWGSNVFLKKEFESIDDAKKFYNEHNESGDLNSVPDYYISAHIEILSV